MQRRRLIVVVALALALTVGAASGVSPAFGASTSSRIKSLERKVKTIQAQVASLLARVQLLEARPLAGPAGPMGAKGDRGEQGPAGPQGSTGATGPAGASADELEAAFWPFASQEASTVVENDEVLWYDQYPDGTDLRLRLSCRVDEGSRCQPSEAWAVLTFPEGQVKPYFIQDTANGMDDLFIYYVPNAWGVVRGESVRVEFWTTVYGTRMHGVRDVPIK